MASPSVTAPVHTLRGVRRSGAAQEMAQPHKQQASSALIASSPGHGLVPSGYRKLSPEPFCYAPEQLAPACVPTHAVVYGAVVPQPQQVRQLRVLASGEAVYVAARESQATVLRSPGPEYRAVLPVDGRVVPPSSAALRSPTFEYRAVRQASMLHSADADGGSVHFRSVLQSPEPDFRTVAGEQVCFARDLHSVLHSPHSDFRAAAGGKSGRCSESVAGSPEIDFRAVSSEPARFAMAGRSPELEFRAPSGEQPRFVHYPQDTIPQVPAAQHAAIPMRIHQANVWPPQMCLLPSSTRRMRSPLAPATRRSSASAVIPCWRPAAPAVAELPYEGMASLTASAGQQSAPPQSVNSLSRTLSPSPSDPALHQMYEHTQAQVGMLASTMKELVSEMHLLRHDNRELRERGLSSSGAQNSVRQAPVAPDVQAVPTAAFAASRSRAAMQQLPRAPLKAALRRYDDTQEDITLSEVNIQVASPTTLQAALPRAAQQPVPAPMAALRPPADVASAGAKAPSLAASWSSATSEGENEDEAQVGMLASTMKELVSEMQLLRQENRDLRERGLCSSGAQDSARQAPTAPDVQAVPTATFAASRSRAATQQLPRAPLQAALRHYDDTQEEDITLSEAALPRAAQQPVPAPMAAPRPPADVAIAGAKAPSLAASWSSAASEGENEDEEAGVVAPRSWPREKRDVAVHAALECMLDEVRRQETERIYESDWSSSPSLLQLCGPSQEAWCRISRVLGSVRHQLATEESAQGQPAGAAWGPTIAFSAAPPIDDAAEELPVTPRAHAVCGRRLGDTSPRSVEGDCCRPTGSPSPRKSPWHKILKEMCSLSVFEAELKDLRPSQGEVNGGSDVDMARAVGSESWRRLRKDLGVAGAVDALMGEVRRQQMEEISGGATGGERLAAGDATAGPGATAIAPAAPL